jgi:hypothetical protein
MSRRSSDSPRPGGAVFVKRSPAPGYACPVLRAAINTLEPSGPLRHDASALPLSSARAESITAGAAGHRGPGRFALRDQPELLASGQAHDEARRRALVPAPGPARHRPQLKPPRHQAFLDRITRKPLFLRRARRGPWHLIQRSPSLPTRSPRPGYSDTVRSRSSWPAAHPTRRVFVPMSRS